VAYTNKPDLKAHAAVTRQSASEGMVLLKNKGTLPLSGEIKDIAAFGNTSYDLISGGTGSGDVNEAYTISLEQGLANAGYKMDGNVNAFYMKHLNKLKAQREKDIQAAIKKTGNPWVRMMFRGPFPEVIPYTALIKKAAKESDVAIITIGRNSGEGKDRSEEGDFTLNDAEVSLIKTVTNAFHQAGKKAVVVLNIGGVIETASWKEIPDAILLAWQGGQECGNSIADILKGNVNPSGKLPMTFPVAWADHESSKNFPIVKAEKRDISDLFGMKKNEGKQPEKNVDFTNYAESIYVGYRCFDHFNRPVSYPFGFGLSYTTFEYSDFALSNKKGEITLTCTVKNTGKYAGKEVVELFVAAPGKDMAKPARELRTFAKTKDLQPGEAETVTMKFPVNDLASYNTADHQWQVEKGAYKALFCASEKDIRGTVDFNIKKEITFKD
jgi:beta-glucosidase